MNPERMFERFDANGDGKITEDELPEDAMAVGERGMVNPELRGSPIFTELGLTSGGGQSDVFDPKGLRDRDKSHVTRVAARRTRSVISAPTDIAQVSRDGVVRGKGIANTGGTGVRTSLMAGRHVSYRNCGIIALAWSAYCPSGASST